MGKSGDTSNDHPAEGELSEEQKKGNLVWIDLEMTGLELESNVILEIATIITDSELNILAEGPDLAIHQPEAVLAAMDEWNTNQHGKSGLLDRVRESNLSVEDAMEETLEFVQRYCLPRTSPLCGNSVGHDKNFLRRYMPEIVEFLHYRVIDVSTYKETLRRWYGKKFQPPKKEGEHRALTDIRESIAELAYYRKNFLKDPGELPVS